MVWLLILMLFQTTLVYGQTERIPLYKVSEFISGYIETILYGSEEGYRDFCVGEAVLTPQEKKELFLSKAEQKAGRAYVDMSDVTVIPSKKAADKYGSRFTAYCYFVKAQHSPWGFDYYRLDLDLSVNILNGKKKITKIYGKKISEVKPEKLPTDMKEILDGLLEEQLPEGYGKKIKSERDLVFGSLSDLIENGILGEKRVEVRKDGEKNYSLLIGNEPDEGVAYLEQYDPYEITFVKPQDNNEWTKYKKFTGFEASVHLQGGTVSYTYTTSKGQKATGVIKSEENTWVMKNIDLTKPVVFSAPFEIKSIQLK